MYEIGNMLGFPCRQKCEGKMYHRICIEVSHLLGIKVMPNSDSHFRGRRKSQFSLFVKSSTRLAILAIWQLTVCCNLLLIAKSILLVNVAPNSKVGKVNGGFPG